jgi:hypothetical protein
MEKAPSFRKADSKETLNKLSFPPFEKPKDEHPPACVLIADIFCRQCPRTKISPRLMEARGPLERRGQDVLLGPRS